MGCGGEGKGGGGGVVGGLLWLWGSCSGCGLVVVVISGRCSCVWIIVW